MGTALGQAYWTFERAAAAGTARDSQWAGRYRLHWLDSIGGDVAIGDADVAGVVDAGDGDGVDDDDAVKEVKGVANAAAAAADANGLLHGLLLLGTHFDFD